MRDAYAIILAGGYGTRFWPASRQARPKQFLPLAGKESLLQQTYRRVARLFPPRRIYVVGNAEHARLLRQQLPRLPRRNLLLEPVGRNTAAAVALAAEHILDANLGRDAVLGVFPSDHAIRHEARLRRVVRAALATAAGEEAMVVLGIPPTAPHTGYGYIERGRPLKRAGSRPVYAVRRFTEKPDARTAARYLRSGRFYWNSGMFFWRLSTFDGLLRRYRPSTRATFARLGANPRAADLRRAYRRLESISVDYALAEPAAARGEVCVIPAEMGWSDLGSWSALYDWQAKRGKNVVGGPGFLLDAAGNWVEAPGKFVAAVGVRDLVVVDTPDALLVTSRHRTQDVGKVVDYLRAKKLRRLL